MPWEGAAALVALCALIVSLVHIHSERRRTANAAVIDLMMRFQSVEYHETVRGPAWHCLRQARHNEAYRQKLASQIFAHSTTNETAQSERYERWRSDDALSPEEEVERRSYQDRHRLLDILAFFAALSAVEGADKTIMRTGNFHYEGWRWALGRLLADIKQLSGEPSSASLELRHRRRAHFEYVLARLDQRFGLSSEYLIVEPVDHAIAVKPSERSDCDSPPNTGPQPDGTAGAAPRG